jgi:hypothetical protein
MTTKIIIEVADDIELCAKEKKAIKAIINVLGFKVINIMEE